jgi:hypothetical protein
MFNPAVRPGQGRQRPSPILGVFGRSAGDRDATKASFAGRCWLGQEVGIGGHHGWEGGHNFLDLNATAIRARVPVFANVKEMAGIIAGALGFPLEEFAGSIWPPPTLAGAKLFGLDRLDSWGLSGGKTQ